MVDKCFGDAAVDYQNLSIAVMLAKTAGIFGGEPCYNKYNDINDTDYNQTEYKKAQFTFFAPTNDAFHKLPAEVLEAIMDNVTNPNAMRNLLFG